MCCLQKVHASTAPVIFRLIEYIKNLIKTIMTASSAEKNYDIKKLSEIVLNFFISCLHPINYLCVFFNEPRFSECNLTKISIVDTRAVVFIQLTICILKKYKYIFRIIVFIIRTRAAVLIQLIIFVHFSTNRNNNQNHHNHH